MKHLLLLLTGCFIVIAASAQSIFEYRPSFSAIVVQNVEASSQWYQSLLGLKVKSRMADPNAGYNIVILESSNFTVELLELKDSLVPKKLMEGKPQGTQIQGHFKIGFEVSDMNACLKQLASLNIKVQQVWTDQVTKKRNFLISDPDGNLIQFFE